MSNEKIYYVCDRCNGTGFINITPECLTYCNKCHGFRKLNWIERIFGRKSLPNHDEVTEINKKIKRDIYYGIIKVDECIRILWGKP